MNIANTDLQPHEQPKTCTGRHWMSAKDAQDLLTAKAAALLLSPPHVFVRAKVEGSESLRIETTPGALLAAISNADDLPGVSFDFGAVPGMWFIRFEDQAAFYSHEQWWKTFGERVERGIRYRAENGHLAECRCRGCQGLEELGDATLEEATGPR